MSRALSRYVSGGIFGFKNYLLSLGVFWTFGGMVLLAYEVKQLKKQVEDLSVSTGKPSGTPTALPEVSRPIPTPTAASTSSQGKGQELRPAAEVASKSPILVAAPSPAAPSLAISEAPSAQSQTVKASENEPKIEPKTESETPALSEAPQSLSVKSESNPIQIDELKISETNDKLAARFFLKSSLPGQEVEGHIAAKLIFTTPAGRKTIASVAGFEAQPVTTATLRQYGQFYRVKYRILKLMEFALPDSESIAGANSKVELEFYYRHSLEPQSVAVIKMETMLQPDLAQGDTRVTKKNQ